MDSSKIVSDTSISTPTPRGKSWVASRFIVIDEGGIAKRRCTFRDCTKEYARGTSHMILKRHWSKEHDDQFSETTPSTNRPNRNTGGNPSQKKKKNPNITSKDPLNIIATKTKVNRQDSTLNTPNSNTLDGQLDVKLVAKRLKEAVSIHITFDIYTAKKGGKSYGIITAHSSGDSLDVKSVLLDYRHMPYPDDSTTVYETLRACITKFNIREKIVSLSSSCSSAIETAVHELDKRYRLSKNFNFSTVHIKCFPQFVHLNVIEILKSQETLVESVRKVIGYINNSNFTLRPLPPDATDATTAAILSNNASSNDNNNLQSASDPNLKATGLKLPYDNRSNWNTTYNMIETFIQQRGFIEPTLLYFQNPQDLSGSSVDWDRLYMLNQLLKPFYEVISKFASDNYTPVSLVAVCIPHLMDHLSNSSWAYDDLVMAAHNFKLNLETYRQEFQSDLTVIAGLLDPRVKDTFVSTEGRDAAINILQKRLESSGLVKNETQTHQHSNDSLWSRLFRGCSDDEIVDYLECPREHGYSSTFAFWESHKYVYPGLYILAKPLVCVQAASVSSDRMFCAAGNAERERKSVLDSTNSKELMKSWAKYLEK